jgi:predicted deacetylase
MTLPRPAQYLLRIDDLCPTVHAERWSRLRTLVEQYAIRPILAVVPDNHDPDLDASPPDPIFWDSMRTMQAAGAAIAMHGFTHVCDMHGKSLIPSHRMSEFAGATLEAQRDRIARGHAILRSQGLSPRLFVAPRHGFDRNTLHALCEQGIAFLSDGFARIPFARFGVTWIPMQLWSPVVRTAGLWTICIHPNTADDACAENLRRFLNEHAPRFTSFDQVTAEFAPEPLCARERALELIAAARLHFRGWYRRRSRRPTRVPANCPPAVAESD